MDDYMESEDDQGGTTSINVEDFVGDLKETNRADHRKNDKDWGERQQTLVETENFGQTQRKT